MYRILLLSFSLFWITGVSSQSNNLSKEKDVKFIVEKQLKELYGEYYNTNVDAQQFQFYTDFYKRCEFISLDQAPKGTPNISSLEVMDKYNPNAIFHDNLKTFNKANFNVLKYRLNYYNKTDVYYKIYKE